MSTQDKLNAVAAMHGGLHQERLVDEPIAVLVEREYLRMRARDAARARIRAEDQPPDAPFDHGMLADLRATRPATPPFRVEQLIPDRANTLVSAQRKTGKTTLAGLNLARCLVTGEKFLGRFDTRPVEGNVGILNYEVSGHTLESWMAEHEIPPDRVYLNHLRGRANPLATEDGRRRLANALKDYDVEALIVDPFGRAYTGSSQNDAGEVTAWLVSLDRLVREVGVLDLILTCHTGWNAERTRGSSALEDWPDSILALRRSETEDRKRYLMAIGRDVELPESALAYDTLTRTLTMTDEGSRAKVTQESNTRALAMLVVQAASDHPGLNQKALVAAVREMDDRPQGLRNGAVAKAARWAEEHSMLEIKEGGRGRANTHWPVPDHHGRVLHLFEEEELDKEVEEVIPSDPEQSLEERDRFAPERDRPSEVIPTP